MPSGRLTGPDMPPSCRTDPGRRRTPPSRTSRWPPTPARSRPDRLRGRIASPSTTNCCGSRRTWATPPSFWGGTPWLVFAGGGSRIAMAPLSADARPTLRSRLRLVAILLLALVTASVMGNRGLLRLYEMRRARTALTREVGDLAAANAALAEEVRALRTDPARIETI